ncbi:MAG: hypothetical protein ACYTFG_00060 [Planctomycetota bacterium]|jgi:uncharacterized protein YukE
MPTVLEINREFYEVVERADQAAQAYAEALCELEDALDDLHGSEVLDSENIVCLAVSNALGDDDLENAVSALVNFPIPDADTGDQLVEALTRISDAVELAEVPEEEEEVIDDSEWK